MISWRWYGWWMMCQWFRLERNGFREHMRNRTLMHSNSISTLLWLNKNFWMHVFIWVGIYEGRQRALKWNRSLTQFPFLLENCFTRLSVEMKHEKHNNVRVLFNIGYFIWISSSLILYNNFIVLPINYLTKLKFL